MKFSDVLWEIIDNGMYVLHLSAVLLIGLSAIACPLWLSMIHREMKQMREEFRPCECRHDDRPVPVLPRVLPRLRRVGEEAD